MSDTEPFTLWRDHLPGWLEREHVVLAPGETRRDVHREWHDALVVVEYGGVVLTGGHGWRLVLEQGAVLTLAGLAAADVHNHYASPAMLAVGRRVGASPVAAR